MIGMWVSFVLLLTVGGSLADNFIDCSLDRCRHLSPEKYLMQINGLPDAEELTLICPALLPFIECAYDETKVCTGYEIHDLASSDNKTISAPFSEVLNLGNLVIDVCNESTSIHSSYVSAVPCFREMSAIPNYQCREDAIITYHAYKASTKLVGDDETDEKDDDQEENERMLARNEEKCLKNSYTVACLSNEIQVTCGEVACSTFVEILRRLKGSISRECSESAAALKSSFLDFLKFEEEKKKIFSEVFNAVTD